MEKNYEGIGATEFDYPDSQNPKPHAPMYYGDNYPSEKTNTAAKKTNGEEVMRQVMGA